MGNLLVALDTNLLSSDLWIRCSKINCYNNKYLYLGALFKIIQIMIITQFQQQNDKGCGILNPHDMSLPYNNISKLSKWTPHTPKSALLGHSKKSKTVFLVFAVKIGGLKLERGVCFILFTQQTCRMGGLKRPV